MGNPLKFISWLISLLLILLVVGALVLPRVIDPNDFKPQIAAAVKERTGRTLEIEGDISLSVFPWLGLDIGAAQISNAAGFAAPHMAQIDQAQVRVKLLPLLKKQLEVDKITLSGLDLYLGKDKSGRSNWADLQDRAMQPGKAAPAGDGAGAKSAAALESLVIAGIRIADARLLWDDQASGSRYELNALSLETGAIEPGKRFDLDLQFNLASAGSATTQRITLDGGVLVAPGLNAFDIDAVKLKIDAAGDSVPAGKMSVTLATDVDVDLDAQTLKMPAVVLKTLGMNITGNISGTHITGDAPQFTGKFDAREFSPRALIQALGVDNPVTADNAVLASASAGMQWKATTSNLTVNTLQLRIDDTTVNGTARVASFDAPVVSFALSADQLDLDRYLPPGSAGKKQQSGQTDTASGPGEAGEIPLEALRNLNLNGRLDIASLKAFNLNSSDVELQIKAAKGLLRITPARANLYEGRMQNEITLDVRDAMPRLTFDYNLDQVNAGTLLRDLTGAEKLLGKTSLRSNISAVGLTADAIKRSMNGTATFSFTDGTVKGVNIAALLRKARAQLKGEPLPASDEPNQTDFTELSGTVVISDGVIRNNDLVLNSSQLQLTGKGKASLPDETIDYKVSALLVGSLTDENAVLKDLKGFAIPVRIGGTFSNPRYTPDIGAALKAAAEARMQEKVGGKIEERKQEIRDKIDEKIGEKLGDKLGEELQDKLKGLFR